MGASDAEWMQVGRIAGVFGLRGELKMELRTDYPERLRQFDELYLGAHHHAHVVENIRPHKSMMLLTLRGIDTPEGAAELVGMDVTIPRVAAAPLPKGHYYLDDLVGFVVSTAEGRDLGAISEVMRTGSNDVYAVGSGRDAILIPGIKDAVRSLDFEGKRMVVEQWVLTASD